MGAGDPEEAGTGMGTVGRGGGTDLVARWRGKGTQGSRTKGDRVGRGSVGGRRKITNSPHSTLVRRLMFTSSEFYLCLKWLFQLPSVVEL